MNREDFKNINKETSEEMLNKHPWMADFLERIEVTTRTYSLAWLKVVSAIDASELGNEANVHIFQGAILNTLEDLVKDMFSLYEKHVDAVAKYREKLQQLEIQLYGKLNSSSAKGEEKNMSLLEVKEGIKLKVDKLVEEIKSKEKKLEKLQQKYVTLTNKLGGEQFSLNSGENLQQKVRHLENQVRDKENKDLEKMENLKIQLEDLWKQVDTPVENRVCFLESAQGSSEKNIQALEKEIRHLQSLKHNNVQKLIELQKKKLNFLYDICHCGGSIRNDFPAFYTTEPNDVTLDIFRAEVEKWEKYYEEHKELLHTLQMYKRIVDDILEYEVNTDKNELYKNRGGKLLGEVRKINVLKCRLKKTEKKLIDFSTYYLMKHGRPFLTFDKTIEMFIQEVKHEIKPVSKDIPITSVKTTSLKIPKNNLKCLTPSTSSSKKLKKTPKSEPSQKIKYLSSKKTTPLLPVFKINDSKGNVTKRRNWRPSIVSSNLANKVDEESVSEYDDFERDVKTTQSRSTSLGKLGNVEK